MAGASRAAAAIAALSLTLPGCATPVAGPGGLYARPLGDAPVTANPMAEMYAELVPGGAFSAGSWPLVRSNGRNAH